MIRRVFNTVLGLSTLCFSTAAGAQTSAPSAAEEPAWSAEETGTTGTTALPTDPAPEEKHSDGHLAFGSFGRVHAASDLRGRTGVSSNIVAFGSRTDLSDYAELELRREDKVDELELTIDATMAFSGEFFHFDSSFDESIAIRNLYADVNNVFLKGLGVWAGSRMVRGDDIYLLNVWLLDNLNLIGGGIRYTSDRYDLSLHGGLTRPNNPFYKQTIDVVPALGFTPQPYDLLDRPRTVVAFKGTYFLMGKAEKGVKLVGYGEGHHLPSGEREGENAQPQKLPSDTGFVIGARVGIWENSPKGFLNVFARYADGIAVYDPLATPMPIGTVTNTDRASEWRVGFSQSIEKGALGLQLGGYMRGQKDERATDLEGSKLLEGAIDARPYLWFGKYAGFSFDASYQALARSLLDDRTGKQVRGAVTKLAAIPFISPYGRGTYTRPHIHLIYQLSLRDEGAQALYPERDPRSHQATEHYFAVGAEWWFNSTSY